MYAVLAGRSRPSKLAIGSLSSLQRTNLKQKIQNAFHGIVAIMLSHVGDRCSMVTLMRSSARAGTMVMAVAPEPMTTTYLKCSMKQWMNICIRASA